MYPSINQLNVRKISLSYENWPGLLKKPVNERPEFSLENGTISIGQILCEFLGVPVDTDEYYNQLYDYVNLPEFNFSLLSDTTLDRTIDNQHFQSIQKVLNLYYEQHFSINRFTAFLDGEKLLLSSEIPALHRKIREAMIATLEHFANREMDGLRNPEFRRVLVDMVKWSFNHLMDRLQEADPQRQMPKYIWYGDYKKSHQYFLYYLIELGCDIVIFHPEGKDPLAGLLNEKVFTHHFENKLPAEPFPKEKRNRKATIAYKASREIEHILNHDGTGLYKPWQFREYEPQSVTLKTTYDELFILAKEPAMIRPDFKAADGHVHIPSLFAKIQGVSKNRKEYWDRLHALTNSEHSLLIQQFPFTSSPGSDYRFHYRNALGADGSLSTEKMMNAHYWPYSYLPSGLQKGIAGAIRRMCEKAELKTLGSETPEEIKIYLFSQAMRIPENIIHLLERFDYSQHVPKCVIYNNEQNGALSRSDAALLLLLDHLGADIVIYNPTGHNDIENYLNQRLFDTHWLEEVIFDLPYKETSRLKKAFFQGILKNLRGE